MKSVLAAVILAIMLPACTGKKKIELLPPPAGKEAVSKELSGKKYHTEKLALISTLAGDRNNPYEWFEDIKDTSIFFKKYRDDRMKFALQFINDSTAVVKDASGDNHGNWEVSDKTPEGEQPGLFARFSFTKNEVLFPGQSGSSVVTYTYRVLGISPSHLFLETPNMFNNRKLAVLMKAE
jgi:hypothetical protein